MEFASHFDAALPYGEYLHRFASPGGLRHWTATYDATQLTPDQVQKLQGFERKLKVLCVTGTWCPDCSAQCPILQRFAEACPAIDLRFLDRDEFAAAGGEFLLCGGQRVPTVIFLSEDDYFCGVYGDRSLTRYRQLAGEVPPGDVTPLQAITQEWLNEFERIQLMLVTSPRLHGLHRS